METNDKLSELFKGWTPKMADNKGLDAPSINVAEEHLLTQKVKPRPNLNLDRATRALG